VEEASTIDIGMNDLGRRIEVEREMIRRERLAQQCEARANAITEALTVWAAATDALASAVAASEAYGSAQVRGNLLNLANSVREQITRQFVSEERIAARGLRLRRPEQLNRPQPSTPPA